MAWVSVHENVVGSKLRNLAKEIGRSQEEALGILVSLWLWGLRNADKEGRLVSAGKDDVLNAFSVKLVSELTAVDIVESLIKTNWMDEPEPGVLYIHDWDQWQEQWYKAVEKREKDAKRKAESRKRKASAQGSQPDAADLETAETETLQAPAQKPAEPSENLKYAPAFEQFWLAYPRKIEKGNAYKKYQARRKDGFSDEELIEAARAYAIQCKKQKTEKQFIKHPKTFLSDSLPFLDYLPKDRRESAQPEQNGGNPFAEWSDDSE